MELLVHTEQPARLASVIAGIQDTELETLSHFVAEPAGTSLEPAHPLEAARIWRAQGIRILAGRKSQHYGATVDSFARAKHGYARADRIDDWQAVLVQVQGEHRRKSRFIPCFEALVHDADPGPEPSFLDRAKSRWTPPGSG